MTEEYYLKAKKEIKEYEKQHNINSKKCDCDGWGCRKCCSSDEEIRSRQGIYG